MRAFLSVCFMGILLALPGKGSAAALHAIRIWGLDVVPSLFPYMVLCQSLSSSLLVTGQWGTFLSLGCGLLGGSPSGSAVLSILARNGRFSRRTLRFLTPLCTTISPMFYLGTIANWWDSAKIAKTLMLCQYGGALAAGALMAISGQRDNKAQASYAHVTTAKYENPITQSVHSVLAVGGCIVFYSVAAECIGLCMPASAVGFTPIIHGLLEVSGGMHALSLASEWTHSAQALLAAGLCGFGGISIFSQNMLFLREIGIDAGELTASCILRAFFSMVFLLFLF